MKKFLFIFLFFFIGSCGNIEFIYKDNINITNPLYNKTKISVSGKKLNFMNSYLPMFFGENKNKDYELDITVEENKIKRFVETNQVTSNVRYELIFFYTLTLNEQNCIIFEKEILSYFSIFPKSAGYNYGTDTSLEKKYEIAITENLNEFNSYLSNVDIKNCK